MPSRKSLFVLAAASIAGVVFWRRRGGGQRERVDLYYDDGSMISLPPGSPDAGRLIPLARQVLEAARS